jgi:hypothetical protein
MKAKLSRLYAKTADLRNGETHRLTAMIAQSCALAGIEDLNAQGMTRAAINRLVPPPIRVFLSLGGNWCAKRVRLARGLLLRTGGILQAKCVPPAAQSSRKTSRLWQLARTNAIEALFAMEM